MPARRHAARFLGLSAIVLAMLVPVLPAGAHSGGEDPTAPGSLGVTRIEYEAGPTVVTGDLNQPYPEELRGSLHIPDGAGPFPLILLLHGRHSTCRYVGVEQLGSPCPDTPATTNIRSYRGYDYLAQNLASHGYLVVSANANGINTYDTTSASGASGAKERAQLIARTLDLVESWNRTAGPGDVGSRLIGRVDMSRIGLMGHSRGGEGVTEFIAYNRTRSDGPRYTGLRAVLALAATDFRDQTPTGVHFGAILPLCDGDVSDLQGGNAFDRSRFIDPQTPFARVQWAVEGANHNYFNTIWTNDDNGNTTGSCADAHPARLSADEQQRVGLALMAAFLRRYVGEETQFESLMRGAEALPALACPSGETSCPDLVRTSYLAPTANRTLLLEPQAGQVPLTTGAATAASCRGVGGAPACPSQPNRSLAQQLTLEWEGPGALHLDLGAPVDASRFTAFTLRAAVNHTRPMNAGIGKQNVEVVLVDAAGRRAAVSAASFGPALLPARESTTRHVLLNGVWIPLSAFVGVDLSEIERVELVVGSSTATGSIQLAELAFQG